MAKNAKGKAALADKPATMVNLPIETAKVPFLQTKGGKVLIGFIAFCVLFTFGYGLWRLSGGSFKPKTACPDVATESRLRDTAATTANFAAQMEYAEYLYIQCKKYDVAKEAYQKAASIAILPGSSVANTDKAKAYIGTGLAYFYGPRELKAAQTEFKNALIYQADNLTALYMLGTTYRPEDKAQAINYFKKVVELAPDSEFGKSAKTQVEELSK
jgi:tetratricopeptide (TPR) repeat protein